MKLSPDTTSHIDLTASLKHLKSSLTPTASEFSGVTTKLYRQRIAATSKAAEEFSTRACWLMAGWIIGATALLSVCVILWARQPDISPTQLRALESK